MTGDLKPTAHELRAVWEQKWTEVSSLTDRSGTAVDRGIKETVVALQLLSISTVASCEGHADHGSWFPSVKLAATNAEVRRLEARRRDALNTAARFRHEAADAQELAALDAREVELGRQVRAHHLQEASKAAKLLAEFYTDRSTSFDRRLILAFAAQGRSHICNQGAELQAIETEDTRRTRLVEYQQEMTEFGAFLRRKFLSGRFTQVER